MPGGICWIVCAEHPDAPLRHPTVISSSCGNGWKLWRRRKVSHCRKYRTRPQTSVIRVDLGYKWAKRRSNSSKSTVPLGSHPKCRSAERRISSTSVESSETVGRFRSWLITAHPLSRAKATTHGSARCSVVVVYAARGYLRHQLDGRDLSCSCHNRELVLIANCPCSHEVDPLRYLDPNFFVSNKSAIFGESGPVPARD